ncbi:hypothetical protein [Caudoviricetes sp.]|nr:hypothetical protein [Caudoviricetes sp.]
MDGLLGGNQLGTLGLLGLNPDEINRSRNQAQSDMYFALASQLLGGGPTGASIAKGLQMGQQAYRNSLNEQTAERMQQVKLQEYLRQQQEAQAAKMRQAQVEKMIGQAYQPAVAGKPAQMVEEDGRYIGETPAVAARPAQFDISGTAPLLMALPEGRKALTDIMAAQKAMAGETFKLGEGEKQYQRDPLTGQVKEVAAGAQKAKALKEVDLGNVVVMLDSDGREVMRFPKGRAPEGPVSMQTIETEKGVMTFNPRTGALSPIMQDGKPVMGKGSGALTEGQGTAVAYGMRMSEADKILAPLENAGLKDTGKGRALVSGIVGSVPLIGESLSTGTNNIFNALPTFLGGLNEDQQKTVQARVNFITAVLRKESGASISPTEFSTTEKVYFPAPGDSEAIVKQKQKARQTAINGMKIQAGPKAEKYFSQDQGVTSSGW